MPCRSVTSEKICIDLNNVNAFLNFIYFYKANAAAIVAGGMPLSDLTNTSNLRLFISSFNNYVKSSIKKDANRVILREEDFAECARKLESEDLVEFKEYVKWSAKLYKIKTSGTFATLGGIGKIAEAADKLFNVRIRDKSHLMIIDVPPEYVDFRQVMSAVNRRFHAIVAKAAGRLGFTELFILANALLVEHAPDCRHISAKMAIISKKLFTSVELTPAPLCVRREFARFYVDLVNVKSEYSDYVASALLTYMQTYDEVKRDPAPLYTILRSMSAKRDMTKGEQNALKKLAEAVSGP